jgi:hypothetical protein
MSRIGLDASESFRTFINARSGQTTIPKAVAGHGVTAQSRSEDSTMQARVVSVLSHLFELSVFIFAAAALAVGAVNLR